MSSAILYAAIIAIWAFALVPRWLRRQHASPEFCEYADDLPGRAQSEVPERETAVRDRERYRSAPSAEPAPSVQGPPAPALGQRRVVRARRRMLMMLLALVMTAAGCTYLKLTSWWVCIPPVVMLGMYLLLLRESALADAEQERWRAAEEVRVLAARQRARPVAPAAEAQVIDISERLGDQLYDQYADAAVRAVGD